MPFYAARTAFCFLGPGYLCRHLMNLLRYLRSPTAKNLVPQKVPIHINTLHISSPVKWQEDHEVTPVADRCMNLDLSALR